MDDQELDSKVIEIKTYVKSQEYEKGMNLIRSLFQDTANDFLGIKRIEGQSYFDYIETMVFWWGDEFRDGTYQMVKVFQEVDSDIKALNGDNFNQCHAGLLRFLISITSDPELNKNRNPQSPQDYRSIIYGLVQSNLEIRKSAKKLLRDKKWKKRILEQWKAIAPELNIHNYFINILNEDKSTKKLAKEIKNNEYNGMFEDLN